MAKRCLALKVTACFLLTVVVWCPGCSPGDGDGPEGSPEDLSQQAPAKPAFEETSTANLTHKGRTLDFKSAIGSMPADSKVLQIHFFPYELSDPQKAELVEGSTPSLVNDDVAGHDPENWPHKPTFAVKIRFKDDAEGCTVEDVDGCNLSIRGWENSTSTSGVPVKATIDALSLEERKAGARLTVQGSATGSSDDETSVTFEADTILLVPPF